MEGFDPVRLAFTTHEPVGGADKNLSPIIFLHGLSLFKETWEDIPQTVADATKRLCYSVDARNHGDSEWSDEFSFDLNVNDLIHFMDTRRIKKAILVGQCMGGITSLRTALKAPNRVEKVFVEEVYAQNPSHMALDMVVGYLHVMRQAIEEAPADFDEDGIKKFIMHHVLSHTPLEMKDQLLSVKNQDPGQLFRLIGLKRGAYGRYTFKYNMDVILKALENRETLLSEPEGVFDGPSFFIYGKESPFYRAADHEKMYQLFPKAVLEVIEEAGHDVHFAKPQEFTNVLLKFLS